MQKRVALFVLCISIILPILPAFAQLEEQVGVNLLEIWVKVTDKNDHVINDLTAQDFHIFIDGKESDVRCFEKAFYDPLAFAKNDQTAAEPDSNNSSSSNSDAQKRKFIFFFDLLNSTPRSVDYLKQQLNDFLGKNFSDQDEGMVFALLPNVRLGVVQKMTGNREALVATIDKMQGNTSLDSRLRNNEKEILSVLSFARATLTQQTNQGSVNRNPEQIRQARGLARSYAAQEESLSRFTLNSFLSIADYLQGNQFQGRLVMIYVSGGFSLRPGQNYYDIIDRSIDQNSVVGSEDLNFRDRPDNTFYNEVKRTIGTLNRLYVTIYSIDARGLVNLDRGPERDTSQVTYGSNTVDYQRELQDSLVLIAKETGGTAFINSQNYQKGLADLATDMSQQYWLCANIAGASKRGVYHKIEVKVDRPGLKVRHRQGYIE